MRSSQRNDDIDLLRATAITMVIVHHVGRSILRGYFPDLLSEAWTGVDLFFVISRFLVTRSFASWLEAEGEGAGFLARARLAARYCGRRLLRILPPAWLWATVSLVTSLYLNRSGTFGDPGEVFREVLAVVRFQYNYFTVSTGISHITHFWSLAVEEHYYFFLPLFLLFVPKTSARLWILATIVIACVLAKILARRAGYGFGEIQFLTHFRADALAIGSVLGLKARQISKLANNFKTHARLRLIGQIAALIFIGMLWVSPSILNHDQIAYFGYFAFSIMAAYLVGAASLSQRLIPFPTAINRYAVAIGKRSYSLYLIHVPILKLFLEIRFRALDMPTSE